MNRKLLFWGLALMILAPRVFGLPVASYEFATVSNSITGSANLDAVAVNSNTFVCAGAANAPVLAVNTNNFATFAGGNGPGGYLLTPAAWTNTLNSPTKYYWLNCVAAQPNGFIASGTSNAVFVSADGVNWTNWGTVLPAGNQAYSVDGIAYNPVSGTFAAALAVYEASWATNPIAKNGWQPAGFQNQSFAESFRSVTPFSSSNMALCGILGDIRVSSDGGKNWHVSQQANLNYPSLLSVASDGGSDVVCAGDNSLIEVSTNGGPNASSWLFQTNLNIGTTGGLTNFNAVTYGPFVNQFFAGGAVGANGLIVMALKSPGSANWTWTRQTNVWSLQNGILSRLTGSLPALNGVCFANSGFFQGIAMLVGNSGTVVIGGVPPLAPLDTYGNDITNILTEPQVNNLVGTNSAANVVYDLYHPAGVLTMDWYSAQTGGVELATNSFVCQPPASLYGACGTYTVWAQERDLRTGFTSAGRTPFEFTIVPGPPTDAVSATNCGNVNGQFGMCATTPMSVTVVTNAANLPGAIQVNWYDANTNLVAGGTFTNDSDIVTYAPSVAPGIYTFYAQATNPATGLASGLIPLTFQENELPLWISSAPFVTNAVLTNPQTNPQIPNPPLANLALITSIEPGAAIAYDWYTNSDPTVATYENPNAPFALTGISGFPGVVEPASGVISFIPTNVLCGTYTYYVRARVVDPAFTACACESTNLVPVAFVLLPPAPTDAIINWTNVLTGAVQANSPVWVDLLTNAANPPSSFLVNWYSAPAGSNNVVLLNNGTETSLSNRFFHTPTNAACGVFTNWAETMAINTASGSPMVSTNRTPVVFAIIPATPAAVGTFDESNCVEVPNPTFTVAVTNGQTADWYAVPSSGTPVATGTLSYAPTNSSAGTWQYAAQAVDPVSQLASTGAVQVTLTLFNCTNPLTINLNGASGTGTIQWPGNLTLLSTTNLTPPVVWTSQATGSVFSTVNTLTFTNTSTPLQFFRLTN
jgi:hypothetical protein